MIYMVLLGADVLNAGLAITQLPGELATWVKDSGLAPMLVMAAILAVYVLLVLVVGAFVTWLVVPLPSGAGMTRRTRTTQSGMTLLEVMIAVAILVMMMGLSWRTITTASRASA